MVSKLTREERARKAIEATALRLHLNPNPLMPNGHMTYDEALKYVTSIAIKLNNQRKL